jgi:hypothetical protein
VSASWDISQTISGLLAAKNLLDENHARVDGFPEEGRNMTLSLRFRNQHPACSTARSSA